MKFPKSRAKMSVWRYLALGYLLAILIGSILLVLPVSAEEETSYLDALFTATSATCVTGLTPFETGLHWTPFGQVVLLFLIQIGGLGFMTFVSLLILMMRRGLSVYERRAALQAVGGEKLAGLPRLILRIVVGSFAFETAGALLLLIRFIPDYGAGRGIWFAVFHAVSAFCNAGFDLLGAGSLSRYAGDPLVTLTLSALIIVGGLGFCVWEDVLNCRFRIRNFQFYTKVILFVTAALLLLSTGLFLLFEYNNPAYADFGFGERLLCSFFNGVTARTAGFWTTDPSSLSDSGYMLMLVLMFVGGASGSTAGGIKVGTFAVIVTGMFSAFRGRRDIVLGKRRIDAKLLGQALAIFVSYLALILFGAIVICSVEPETAGVERAIFETVSALGTVGLSMSLTPVLSAVSKVVLILLMYAGRVGVLTLAFALGRPRDADAVRYPVGGFFIG